MLQLASHLTLFIGLLCTSTALCQTPVESLTAKGAVFKKDKAGVVTEIRFADNSTLTADDWKEVGKLTTLTRASISRSDSLCSMTRPPRPSPASTNSNIFSPMVPR